MQWSYIRPTCTGAVGMRCSRSLDVFTWQVSTYYQTTSSSLRQSLVAIVYSRRNARLYVLYGRNFTRPSSPAVSREGWGLCLRSANNLCSSSLFDSRITIKCAASSWCLHSISRCHRVLYLMYMRLINDTVYQEGAMCLINNMCQIRSKVRLITKD